MKALSIANKSTLGLALFTAVSGVLVSGCNVRSFALGEGSAEECDRGERGCFCRVASAPCEPSLICIDDRCVDPVADGPQPDKRDSVNESTGGSEKPSNTDIDSTRERDKDSSAQGPSSEPEPGKSCQHDDECDDGNPCTADTCLSAFCRNIALSKIPCDDGYPCTASDQCMNGACVGRDTRVLHESFSLGVASGWRGERGFMDDYFTPDLSASSWEIGPAVASDCGGASRFNSGEDPALDFSQGDDNILAGVVIGGCHEQRGDWDAWDCLFSPPMDLSFFDTEPRVSYYRHLHSPGIRVRRRQRGVEHRVVLRRADESIEEILTGFEKRINDSDWVLQSRRFKSQTQLVSLGFCFRRGPDLPDFAGLSLDEIKIGQVGCQLEDENDE